MSLPKPPNLHVQGPPTGVGASSDSAQVAAELQALRRQLLEPVEEARSLRWTKNNGFIGLLVLGLFPVLAQTIFAASLTATYWCLGLYFSVIWALFFCRFLAPAGVTRIDAIVAFAASAIISIVVLLGLGAVGFNGLMGSYASSGILVQLAVNIVAVGLLAEVCKAAVLIYYLQRGPVPPLPAMVFYGLLAGFGFGLYAATQSPAFAPTDAPMNPIAGAALDFSGIVQLVSLPFVNAMWTGIGAYFWTLGWTCPPRRYALWAVALGVPALLHGLHVTWAGTQPWLAFMIDLLSAFAVLIYLMRGTGPKEAASVPPLPTAG